VSLFNGIEGAPHHSANLKSFFRRNPNRRIYGYLPNYDQQGKKEHSLAETKKAPLTKLVIRICYPEFYVTDNKRKAGKVNCITGKRLIDILQGNRGKNYGDHSIVGIKKRWTVDITERFLEEYRKVGPCAFSNHYHKWESKKNVRHCVHCGKKQKRKIVVTKYESWEYVNGN
jgi:hypothetical protein